MPYPCIIMLLVKLVLFYFFTLTPIISTSNAILYKHYLVIIFRQISNVKCPYLAYKIITLQQFQCSHFTYYNIIRVTIFRQILNVKCLHLAYKIITLQPFQCSHFIYHNFVTTCQHIQFDKTLSRPGCTEACKASAIFFISLIRNCALL